MELSNTNLFKHSPKELVTDGLLTWLLYVLNRSDNVSGRQIFFNELILDKSDKGKSITNIEIIKQAKIKNGSIDLVLYFNIEGEKKCVLFENKTWSSIHSRQLERYKEGRANCYKYIYLKLAYINMEEINSVKNAGFITISGKKLYKTLTNLNIEGQILKQYINYLKFSFVDKLEMIETNLIANNSYNMLNDNQAQEFIMSKLYSNLETRNNYLKLRTGSSYGIPWTELDICGTKGIYNTSDETIFWRIDKRSKKYYIRLNQYSDISVKLKDKKIERLKLLRGAINSLKKKYAKLKYGEVSNRGVKESEIVIFFFNESENSLGNILQFLPAFTKSFIEAYRRINKVANIG